MSVCCFAAGSVAVRASASPFWAAAAASRTFCRRSRGRGEVGRPGRRLLGQGREIGGELGLLHPGALKTASDLGEILGPVDGGLLGGGDGLAQGRELALGLSDLGLRDLDLSDPGLRDPGLELGALPDLGPGRPPRLGKPWRRPPAAPGSGLRRGIRPARRPGSPPRPAAGRWRSRPGAPSGCRRSRPAGRGRCAAPSADPAGPRCDGRGRCAGARRRCRCGMDRQTDQGGGAGACQIRRGSESGIGSTRRRKVSSPDGSAGRQTGH